MMLEPGSMFGAYRVVMPLGCGGMGEVYLVEEPATGNRLAVKVLDKTKAGKDDEAVDRFVREAEFAVSARHPNLVEVYDAGIDPETGLCYLTMEYMAGGSLKDLIESDGLISLPGVVAIAMDVARGLAFIESKSMVHRDVKPDNILFSADGTAKLSDMGITRFEGEQESTSLTDTSGVVGTPAYMAPEQMLDSHAVDSRADIYSLGVVMYEMVTGKRPNAGQNAMNTLAKALNGQTFPDVRTLRPETPPFLADLITAMTIPNPEMRPESVLKVLELLTGLKRSGVKVVKQVDRQETLPWYRDRGFLYAITAMVVAVEILVVTLINVFRG